MTFDSIKEVYDFYNKYADAAGFSIRLNSSKKDREQRGKQIVCSKEGTKKKKVIKNEDNSNSTMEDNQIVGLFKKGNSDQRTHPVSRENYKAAIRIKKDEKGQWKTHHLWKSTLMSW